MDQQKFAQMLNKMTKTNTYDGARPKYNKNTGTFVDPLTQKFLSSEQIRRKNLLENSGFSKKNSNLMSSCYTVKMPNDKLTSEKLEKLPQINAKNKE